MGNGFSLLNARAGNHGLSPRGRVGVYKARFLSQIDSGISPRADSLLHPEITINRQHVAHVDGTQRFFEWADFIFRLP